MSSLVHGNAEQEHIRHVIGELRAKGGQEDVIAALSAMIAEQAEPPTSSQWTLPFLTAATRASFTVGDLRAVANAGPGGEPVSDALARVLDKSLVLPGSSDEAARRYVLVDDARRAVLTDTRGSDELQSAIVSAQASNDRATHYLNQFVESWNRGSERFADPDLLSLNAPDLEAAARAAGMVAGLSPALDHLQGEMRRRLDLEDVIAPLRLLIGKDGPAGTGSGTDTFVGREDVLLRLYEHVGVKPPKSLGQRARRIVRSIVEAVSGAPRGALVVHALGGMGKSALIAKFLLDHVREDANWLLFAYLDFDRSTLAGANAGVLMLEIVRQIGLQVHPGLNVEGTAEAAQRLKDLRERLRRDLSAGAATAIMEYALELQGALEPLPRERRVLLVLDTVERVQAAGPGAVDSLRLLLRCLGLFDGRWARLRVVGCGRSDLAMLRDGTATPEPIALARLTTSEAVDLAQALLSRAAPERTFPSEVTEAIADAAQGYPLFVRALVTHLAKTKLQDDADLIEDLKSAGSQASKVATVLYTRFSDRVGLPGGAFTFKVVVCLRSVTPSLLGIVLRGVGSDLDAFQVNEVFRLLHADETLWAERDDEILRWRPELRALLLGCIRDENHDLMRRVAEAALDAPDAPADRLYYALLAGEGPGAADIFWRPGAGFRGSLSDAVLDFDPQSVEALYLRLVTSRRLPEAPELERLAPEVGWRMSWRAKPDLGSFFSAGVELTQPTLLKLSEAISTREPEFEERRLALLAKTGQWGAASAAFQDLEADGTALGGVDLLNWLARAAPDRRNSWSELRRVAATVLRDAEKGSRTPGDCLVAALVASRAMADEQLFRELDVRIVRLNIKSFAPENLITTVSLAGAFGIHAADWAVDLICDSKSLRSVSLAQLRLLDEGCKMSGISGGKDLADAIRHVDAAMPNQPFSYQSIRDSQTIAAVRTVLMRLLREWRDGSGRTRLFRGFFSLRDPDWLGPLGYAFAREPSLTEILGESVRALVHQGLLPRTMGALRTEVASGDQIAILRELDEAGALGACLELVKSEIATSPGLVEGILTKAFSRFSRSDLSSTAQDELSNLISCFEGWRSIKSSSFSNRLGS